MMIVQRKAFFRQRIPGSSCTSKETVDIDILVKPRNGNRKIMQSIRITSRSPSKIRKWNQFSQFRWTFTKVIPIEKTKVGYILTVTQGFKRGSKWSTKSWVSICRKPLYYKHISVSNTQKQLSLANAKQRSR